MTIEEIKEIRSTVRPTEQEYFDAHSVEIVDTLLAEVEKLNDDKNAIKRDFNTDIKILKFELYQTRDRLERAVKSESELARYREGVEVDGHVCMQELGASVPGLSSALLAYPHKVKVLVMKGE